MPHLFDFSNCIGDVSTVEVNPKGWRGPLTIEYGLAQNNKYDTQASIVWRIKGTSHTFTIYERRLNVFSNGNYKQHFEEVLQNFREDYLSWFRNPEYEEVQWKYEYQSQFGRYILPDTGGDNKS
jgi:hypothetical protein